MAIQVPDKVAFDILRFATALVVIHARTVAGDILEVADVKVEAGG